MSNIRLKRVYEAPSAEDGKRILVDRVWPRGLRRADAAIDCWLKEIAPSTELRHWFGHAPGRWSEFQRLYRAELKRKGSLVQELQKAAEAGPVTLLYAARDERHNQAVVLCDVLLERS